MSWASEVSSRSPILWFKLDETSGTSFANSGSAGSGFNGTGHGGLTLNQTKLGPGLAGGSIVFNGSTGYISVPAGALAGLSAITVLAWIKTTSVSTTAYPVDGDESTNRLFQLRTTGTSPNKQAVIIPITASQLSGSGTISDGSGHLIGFSWLNQASGATNNKVLYLDGSVDAQAVLNASNMLTSDSGLAIGSRRAAAGTFFSGSIQEVVVFGSALSASDISALWAAGSATPSGTAASTLGGVTATATGVRTTPGTAAATLGGVTATATGIRTDAGTASAALGGLTASATSAPPEIDGTATAALGALTAAASSIRTTPGTAAATLGALIATATGTRTTPGIASVALGSVVAVAVGLGGGSGVALADLGALIAAALGTVTSPIVAPTPDPIQWGFQMLAPDAALIPVEAGLDFIEWGFTMLEPGEALIGDPA